MSKSIRRTRETVGVILLAGAYYLLATGTAAAQSRTWNNVTGNWNDSTKWVEGSVPAGGNTTQLSGCDTTYAASGSSSLRMR